MWPFAKTKLKRADTPHPAFFRYDFKEDISLLRATNARLRTEMATLRKENATLRAEIATVREEVANLRSDLGKWREACCSMCNDALQRARNCRRI